MIAEPKSALLPSRLEALATITLQHGGHPSFAVGHCALETVAWLVGSPHTDRPDCVSPVIAAFVRSWNDGLQADDDRNRLLRPILPELVGTATTVADEEARAWLLVDWLARVQAPAWLSLTAGLAPHAAVLKALPAIVDVASAATAREPLAAARAAARAASDAAWAAAGDAARDAAGDAAGDAASDALAPTVLALQASAVELIRTMCVVGRAV